MWQKEMKAGYLYGVVVHGMTYYMVCLGKNILEPDDKTYIFARYIDGINSAYDRGIETFRQIRSNIEIRYGTNNYKCPVFCYGKVVNQSDIKSWLTQLRVTGVNIAYLDILDNPCAYIGDWRKRKKLSCVKSFEVGGLYVSEELAYIRKVRYEQCLRLGNISNMELYDRLDLIDRYLGREEGYYIWESVYFYTLFSSEKAFSSVKRSKTQMKDMVALERSVVERGIV
jgi:hypothetical protein